MVECVVGLLNHISYAKTTVALDYVSAFRQFKYDVVKATGSLRKSVPTYLRRGPLTEGQGHCQGVRPIIGILQRPYELYESKWKEAKCRFGEWNKSTPSNTPYEDSTKAIKALRFIKAIFLQSSEFLNGEKIPFHKVLFLR